MTEAVQKNRRSAGGSANLSRHGLSELFLISGATGTGGASRGIQVRDLRSFIHGLETTASYAQKL